MAKVLIVEDEQLVAQDLSETMTRNGHEVLAIASSGRKAIELAQENRPDLILMDVRIEGDSNGVETAIIIQGQFDHPIPIIFITAFPSDQFPVLQVVDACLYVNKPISEHQLLASVRRALAGTV
jgi:CheY-like chemotaxis protein